LFHLRLELMEKNGSCQVWDIPSVVEGMRSVIMGPEIDDPHLPLSLFADVCIPNIFNFMGYDKPYRGVWIVATYDPFTEFLVHPFLDFDRRSVPLWTEEMYDRFEQLGEQEQILEALELSRVKIH
jgi:hypothetical protein